MNGKKYSIGEMIILLCAGFCILTSPAETQITITNIASTVNFVVLVTARQKITSTPNILLINKNYSYYVFYLN